MHKLVAAMVGGLLAGAAFAQQPPAPPQRILTTTRLVSVFSGIEQQLQTALQKHDDAAARTLLTPDFSWWTPAPPGQPHPADEWLATLSRRNTSAFSIHQMAVQSLGDRALVSFVLREQLAPAAAAENMWIVDLWQQDGSNWKLASRYQAEVKTEPAAGIAARKPVRH